MLAVDVVRKQALEPSGCGDHQTDIVSLGLADDQHCKIAAHMRANHLQAGNPGLRQRSSIVEVIDEFAEALRTDQLCCLRVLNSGDRAIFESKSH
ncbi:hypothetical protein SDC9_201026 [bioreactor metagenome]|uniref:Uncharacterized protein n=1 Tax=bioreactor metagenome TaxID=1076179 RepID=A0A645IR40_9ZZZZ